MQDSPTIFDLPPETGAAVEPTPGEVGEADLLGDVYDAAAFLSMGTDEGLAAHTAASLRRQLVVAAGELARRWGLEGPA